MCGGGAAVQNKIPGTLFVPGLTRVSTHSPTRAGGIICGKNNSDLIAFNGLVILQIKYISYIFIVFIHNKIIKYS